MGRPPVLLILLCLASLALSQTTQPPTTEPPSSPPLTLPYISRPPTSGICPAGQERLSIANITVCSTCATSTYNINGDGICRPCPEEGTVCADGAPRSQRGWWIYEDEVTGVATAYRCPDGFCEKNSTCAAHRIGILCGACEPGYTQFYLAGGPCAKCEHVNWLLMIGIFLALWVVVIAITIGESIDNTAKAKIVIFFVQTLPMVLGPSFRTSDWLELVNLSGGSSSVLSCLAPWNFYQQFLFNILLPYGLFIFLPINYGLQYLIVKFLVEPNWPEPPSDRHQIKDEVRRWIGRPRFNLYVRSGFALLLFNYSTVATAVFSFRGCRRVGDTSVLAAAPEIDCTDSQYKSWNVFAVIMLVYVILMPIVILAFLIWGYKTMRLFRTKYLETAGVLYDAYKMRAFWWEPITLVRRVLIASIYTGLFNSADWRTFAMFLIVTAGFVVHILFYPYRQRVENFVEAYLLLMLQVLAALMASSAVYLFGIHKHLLLGLIITFSILAIIILALWNFMIMGAQKLADKWGNENFKKWVEWTEKKLKEKKVNQPRSLSKFYSWQEKRDAEWAKHIPNPINPDTTVTGDEDRPYYSADL